MAVRFVSTMAKISPSEYYSLAYCKCSLGMELLTPRGWASAYTVEAIIMQFTASLSKGRARISRTKKPNKDFSKQSAEEAFRSLVKTHNKYGWVSPSLAEG